MPFNKYYYSKWIGTHIIRHELACVPGTNKHIIDLSVNYFYQISIVNNRSRCRLLTILSSDTNQLSTIPQVGRVAGWCPVKIRSPIVWFRSNCHQSVIILLAVRYQSALLPIGSRFDTIRPVYLYYAKELVIKIY